MRCWRCRGESRKMKPLSKKELSSLMIGLIGGLVLGYIIGFVGGEEMKVKDYSVWFFVVLILVSIFAGTIIGLSLIHI